MRWPWRHRRAYAGQEWAGRDALWAVVFFVLLLFASLHPVFVLAVAGYLVLTVAYVAYRVTRHRREQQANADKPSWLDDFEV